MALGILGGEHTYLQTIKSLLGTSLIAYWPFNEASGSVANDQSGNARNGAYSGTPILGVVGIGDGNTSVNFNAAGETDVYSAGLATAANPNLGSFSFWSKLNDGGAYADGTNYYAFYFGADANYYYRMSKTSTKVLNLTSKRNATTKTITIGTPTTSRWVHFCITWDTANDRMYLFVNGAKSPIIATLGTWVGNLVASGYARIGDEAPAFGNFMWPGSMAHAALTSSVPTDATIRTIARSNKQIVFVGDSRTSAVIDGWVTPSAELAFPTGNFAYGGRGVSNYGVGGYTWTDITAAAATIDALLIPGGSNTLVAWAGVNQPTALAADIYAQIVAYCNARRIAGWKVILCSEIDSQSNMTWHNTTWPALNTLINADHSFADGYINLAADARLQNALNTTYFNADKIHLVAAGNNVVRDLAYPVIAAIA